MMLTTSSSSVVSCPRINAAAGTKRRVTFTDPEEGEVELMNVKGLESHEDSGKEEGLGEDNTAPGEETKKAVERKDSDENVTLSTFGHAGDESSKKKSEAEKGDNKDDVTEKGENAKSVATTEGKDKEKTEVVHMLIIITPV